MTEVSIRVCEWDSLDPLGEDSPLSGFHFASSAERLRAQELTKAKKLELDELYGGLRVRARAHVGRVRIGRLTLTIVPKVGAAELLKLLRYAYRLRDSVQPETSRYATSGELFEDLIITQLYGEARAILDRGLFRSYRERREDLPSPRGALDVARLTTRYPLTEARLPCRYHARVPDNVLNITLQAGLALAAELTSDPELRLGLGRLQRRMDGQVARARLSAELIHQAKRQLNRLVAPYTSIIQLVKILYEGSLVNLEGAGSERQLPDFLFDMNRFFQLLVERFLVENLQSASVESEHGLAEFMRYADGHNPQGRSSPRPRPDYCIRQRGSIISLLDAKYRDLWSRPLPREMLYQLTVYALSQGRRGRAAILYPAADDLAVPSLIELCDPDSGASAGKVWIRPIQLTRLLRLVQSDEPAATVERERWAVELAGLA